MEWVDKASFAQLNKLFEISASEQDHHVLLIDKNLQTVVKEAKPFIRPILPHLASQSLVPGEHHVLKDLPFYEVARATDSKARQDSLEQMEKKRQDGMLRQTPTTNCLTSSSTICPSTNKK